MTTEVLTVKQLAAKLSIHPETLRKLYRKKLIPCFKLGYRTLRFNEADVLAALTKISQ